MADSQGVTKGLWTGRACPQPRINPFHPALPQALRHVCCASSQISAQHPILLTLGNISSHSTAADAAAPAKQGEHRGHCDGTYVFTIDPVVCAAVRPAVSVNL